MFGTYQHSELRIELKVSAERIGQSLTEPSHLKQWLWPQRVIFLDGNGEQSFSSTTATKLAIGQVFESYVGLANVEHKVEQLTPFAVRFLLSGSIDGFHEWQWGEGWVQSRLEGVSLLPLNLGQTSGLLRLKRYLQP
ncbi:MAG: hypothetical protein DCF15_15620 [Phormidesmis priestleyi]|uniref:Uncharacterized protein n=1 Tax=Phormidesmis priestleyi TaxID=268141 RepID=A0A2W4X1X6_9CYAN|nr:MAG: hypothetical protein DCF15_15620 [Phormidesmis priestleyi]